MPNFVKLLASLVPNIQSGLEHLTRGNSQIQFAQNNSKSQCGCTQNSASKLKEISTAISSSTSCAKRHMVWQTSCMATNEPKYVDFAQCTLTQPTDGCQRGQNTHRTRRHSTPPAMPPTSSPPATTHARAGRSGSSSGRSVACTSPQDNGKIQMRSKTAPSSTKPRRRATRYALQTLRTSPVKT